jgi:ribose 5-phosphate isomerase B
MRLHIGADHAGFDVKQHLVERLRGAGHDVVDHGPAAYDAQDDYPPFCLSVGAAVVADPGSLGIVLGGSGNGEQIAANKVDGVRAALAWSVQTAQLAREHNDANVVGVGARMHALDEVDAIVDAFVGTAYSDEERHTRRIAMLTAYERTGDLPPVPGS